MEKNHAHIIKKHLIVAQYAFKGEEKFPSVFCDFIADHLEITAAALLKIEKTAALTLIGASSRTNHEALDSTSVKCFNCELSNNPDYEDSFFFAYDCRFRISADVNFEACAIIRSKNGERFLLKLSRKIEFDAPFINNLKQTLKLYQLLLNEWLLKRGETAGDPGASVSNIILELSQYYSAHINAIIGASTILYEEKLTETQKQYIANIKASAHILSLIMSDIIQIARLELRRLNTEISPIDVKKEADEVIEANKSRIIKKDINIFLKMEDSAPKIVLINQDAFAFIINALINYSLNRNPKSKIHVSISKVQGENIKIVIEDDAEPIEKWKLKKIFSPSSTLSLQEKHLFDGAGLSLTLTKKYIESLNGSISAENSIEGARFTVILPYDSTHEQNNIGAAFIAADDDPELLGESTLVSDEKNKFKILIAEDYQHSQVIISRILKRNGFINFEFAHNGEEAVKMAKNIKYDLIFMDMEMPVMDGFEAIGRIRRLKGYEKIPIISLTAYAMRGDKQRCIDAGATEYISKPFDKKQLIDIINIHFRKEK